MLGNTNHLYQLPGVLSKQGSNHVLWSLLLCLFLIFTKLQYLHGLLNLICWFSIGENDKELAIFAVLHGLMNYFLLKTLSLVMFLRHCGLNKQTKKHTHSALFLVIALFPSVKGTLCSFSFLTTSQMLKFNQ